MIARKDVHIGKEIERVLRERGMSVTMFADRICCHRRNIYDIFSRKSIDIDRLILISEALEYDFFRKVYQDCENTPPLAAIYTACFQALV